ncbi:CBS domain-containing protein [Tranquillimonas rosea]|uniref:CBS domain-containing protein n=1 Tax=Tranquillimonas rosea TaxID=641238 RepID=A0A1H9X4T9_9RHOB|nr:CBS domain-containing protein [Tranquillimonas rosea]SES40633.1 CBS domain-containing protein [Tranquillimonas rosea]
MTEYRVRGIMRTDGPTLTAETPIRRAMALLIDARAAVAPVLAEDGQMIGLLSQKDCFRPALHASYHREWSGRVADWMSREIVSVEAEDEVIRVAEMFLTHPHRVFPVMDGRLVAGLLHRSDVLALLVRIG